jgi:calmodulin
MKKRTPKGESSPERSPTRKNLTARKTETSSSPIRDSIANRESIKLMSYAKDSKRKSEAPGSPENIKREERPPEVFLHRNTLGGIYVHEKDIETLFKFIDSGNNGRITLADLKKKVPMFAKDMTNRDFKFLMAGKQDLSLRELYDILKYNELEDFDPVAEAFRFYDPDNTGFMDLQRLREVLSMLGYGDLSYGDLQILVECADADLDGKISLEDFRRLIPIYEPDDKSEKTKNVTIVGDPSIHDEFVANLREYGDTRK